MANGTTYFQVPEQYGGKTLAQIQGETGAPFRADVLEDIAGIGRNTPLEVGQTISFRTDPGAGEFQFLSGFFDPGLSPSQQLAKGQADREEGFLTRFRETITGQETLPAMSERLGAELGLPGLRESTRGLTEAAIDLEGLLFGLPGRVAGETRGFDVTQGQLERIQEERARGPRGQLIETARAAERSGGRLAGLESQLGQRLGLGVAQQEKELRPFEAEIGLISERAAREVTLYTADKQNELAVLLQKMQTQGQLDLNDAQRIADLALQEDEYSRIFDQIRLQTDEDIRQSLALRRDGNVTDPGSIFESIIQELSPSGGGGFGGGGGAFA